MRSLQDIVKEKLKAKELYQKEKANVVTKKKLQEFKENGRVISNVPKIVKSEIPEGYRLIKIPDNIKDLTIAKLRTLHADMFGKEPTHDSAHNKIWIANKIIAVMEKQN